MKHEPASGLRLPFDSSLRPRPRLPSLALMRRAHRSMQRLGSYGSLPTLCWRVAALSMVAGYVEVIGYLDFGAYPGIMTGNTVQLGLHLAHWQQPILTVISLAVALFLVGGMLASIIRNRLRWPPIGLAIMAGFLVCAGIARSHGPGGSLAELPLLALAMAMQGQTIREFGGVAVQTIVVTNSMIKFTDALTSRFLPGRRRRKHGRIPGRAEILLPGTAWLAYTLGAAAGALAASRLHFPLVAPALLLLTLTVELLRGH
jgi:uncharacterized membrane protein YoaK (UPF0700 family)